MSQPIEQKFVLSEDAAARQKLVKGIADVEAQQKKLSVELAKGELTSDQYAKSLATLNKQLTPLKRALDPLNKELREQEKNAKAAEKALLEQAKAAELAAKKADVLGNALQEQDDKFNKLSTGVGSFGNIQSNLGATSGLASAAGFGGAGQGVALAGEFSALLEELPRLKESLLSSGTAIQLVTKEIGLGGLSGSLQAAVPALGATGAAIGAIAIVALPVVAAIGAVTVVMAEMKKNADAAADAERRRVELTNLQISTENEYQRMVRAGDVEGIIESREAAWQGLTDNTEQIAVASGEIDKLKEQETALFALRNQAIADLNPIELVKWNNELGIVQARIAEQTTNFNNLAATQGELVTSTTEADAALANFNETEINAAVNAERLAEIQQEVSQTETERVSTLSQLEQANDRVAQAEQQRTQIIEQYAANETRLAEDRGIAESRQLEDRAIRASEHQENLAAIEATGNARVEALRGELASLPAERQAALAKIETDGGKKLDAINRDYMKKATADARAFSESQKRTAQDTNKAISRLAEDNLQKLIDAERGNDVIAYIRAAEEGSTALGRASEDAKTAQERAASDFASKQAEQAEAQKQRLAEAVAQINEEKQRTIDSFAEKRAALAESIEAEKAGIAERTSAAEASYAKELERLALSDARKAEDQKREDDRRKAAHDTQLAQIEERKQKELEAVNAINTALTTLVAKAADLNRQASQITTQSAVKAASSSFSTNPNSSTNTGGIFSQALQASANNAIGFGQKIKLGGGVGAFADGGIVTKPTLALIGEGGYPEAVVPMKPSAGLPSSFGRNGAGSGGQPINITVPINMTVGDIASGSMVRSEIESAVTILLRDGIAPLFMNSIYPTG